ncbi:MAG: transposase [Porphyromonadaceae bacterium]|nr:MAG: transposase [Porphyromonadaceae bacterium]
MYQPIPTTRESHWQPKPAARKSNEIKAIPRLIDKINISGKIVTADARLTQKNIIDRIRENGGDFLIELKSKSTISALWRGGQDQRVRSCIFLHRGTGIWAWQNRDPNLSRL